MRGQSPLLRTFRTARVRPAPSYICWQCRAIQISAPAATDSPKLGGDAFGAAIDGARDSAGQSTWPIYPVAVDANAHAHAHAYMSLCPDARFEVLGSPYSLLSVTLSASQQLYTRRGTLVSVAGKVENVSSSKGSSGNSHAIR